MDITLIASLPLFGIIALGALLRFLKIADEQWVAVLNRFELYIGLPALVLANVLSVSNTAAVGADVIIFNIALLSFVIVSIYLIGSLFKIDRTLRNTYCICIFFGNIAYLGLPFITALIPGSGGSIAIHIVIYVLLLFTLGIALLEWSQRKKEPLSNILLKVISNPLFITSIVGVLVLLFRIQSPEVVSKFITLLAGSASPMALLALGIFIGHKISWDRSLLHAAAISVAKLIIVPLLFIGGAYIFHLQHNISVSVLEAAMPLAVTPFALSQVYLLDKKIISNAVLLSTILALVTLPIMAQLV